jgi:hypothetical protein
MADSPARSRALRLLGGGAVGGGVVWLVCVVAFWLALGPVSLAWTAAGGATVVVFFALGQLVQVLTAEADTIVVMVAALASYAVRAGGLAVVLLLAQPQASGTGAVALAPTMIAVVVGWLATEIWTFTRLRVPAFDEAQGGRR